MENYFNGTIQRQRQTSDSQKRSKRIIKYSIMLKNGEISAAVFISTMANRKNKILYADDEIGLEDIEVNAAIWRK